MTKLAFAALLVTAIRFAAADAPQPHHHHAPPQEAIDACANAKQADACSFTLRDRSIDGTCQPRPDVSTQLACRPDHLGPPPPEGSGSDAPLPPSP